MYYKGGQGAEQGRLVIWTASLIAERSDFHPADCTAAGSSTLRARIGRGTSSCLFIHRHFSSTALRSPLPCLSAGSSLSLLPALPAAQDQHQVWELPATTPHWRKLPRASQLVVAARRQAVSPESVNSSINEFMKILAPVTRKTAAASKWW